MRRDELAHILRAACDVAGDPEILVIGSQAILGAFDDERLPSEAIRSIEADVAFFDDPADAKLDRVDGAIGELSALMRCSGSTGKGSPSPRPSCRPIGGSG